MDLNVETELAALRRSPVSQLRKRYAEVFGEATNSRHKEWLIKRIIYRLQVLAEGDLSDRARRRAAELANDAELRRRPPDDADPKATLFNPNPFLPRSRDRRLPPPGGSIVRTYKGRSVEVRVLPNGFEFEGELFKSLSAVAKRITGSHLSGYRFFGLADAPRAT